MTTTNNSSVNQHRGHKPTQFRDMAAVHVRFDERKRHLSWYHSIHFQVGIGNWFGVEAFDGIRLIQVSDPTTTDPRSLSRGRKIFIIDPSVLRDILVKLSKQVPEETELYNRIIKVLEREYPKRLDMCPIIIDTLKYTNCLFVLPQEWDNDLKLYQEQQIRDANDEI